MASAGHALGLASVQKFQLPQTITGLRAFLGLTNYYAEYVKGYAHLAAPLIENLKVPRAEGKNFSKKKIDWTPEDRVAFEQLKAALREEISLRNLNTDRPFVLRTDASDFAIDAVLEQLADRDGTRNLTVEKLKSAETDPVAFFSQKLTSGQSQR